MKAAARALASPLGAPSPRRRQRILAVADELTARWIAKAYRECELTTVHTSADALIVIAKGFRFDLVLCLLPIPAALALHSAIATQDSVTAGRMAVLQVMKPELVRPVGSVLG